MCNVSFHSNLHYVSGSSLSLSLSFRVQERWASPLLYSFKTTFAVARMGETTKYVRPELPGSYKEPSSRTSASGFTICSQVRNRYRSYVSAHLMHCTLVFSCFQNRFRRIDGSVELDVVRRYSIANHDHHLRFRFSLLLLEFVLLRICVPILVAVLFDILDFSARR